MKTYLIQLYQSGTLEMTWSYIQAKDALQAIAKCEIGQYSIFHPNWQWKAKELNNDYKASSN